MTMEALTALFASVSGLVAGESAMQWEAIRVMMKVVNFCKYMHVGYGNKFMEMSCALNRRYDRVVFAVAANLNG